ncbi:MAG: DUF4893 domain-containing protein [Sphingomonas sp.]|nr:DUF4893 domain-containing protein [Sphingomonas sp.]
MLLAGAVLASSAQAGGSEELDWRRVATSSDRMRLRNWRQAWIEALDHARKTNLDKIVAGGALFDPDRAYSGAIPPAGRYRCRVYKLGAKGTAMAEFTGYPDFACRVGTDGTLPTFYKLEGAQRPAGVFFRDTASRAVFLGTLVIGDERRAMQYGRDASRDLVGYVERVGDKRWRLVLPYPRFESILDVVELVPEGANPVAPPTPAATVMPR